MVMIDWLEVILFCYGEPHKVSAYRDISVMFVYKLNAEVASMKNAGLSPGMLFLVP